MVAASRMAVAKSGSGSVWVLYGLWGGQFCPQPAFSRPWPPQKGGCGQDWPPHKSKLTHYRNPDSTSRSAKGFASRVVNHATMQAVNNTARPIAQRLWSPAFMARSATKSAGFVGQCLPLR